jgi:hypothetical protein
MNEQHELEEPGRWPSGDEGRDRLLAGLRATERELSAIEAAQEAPRRVEPGPQQQAEDQRR